MSSRSPRRSSFSNPNNPHVFLDISMNGTPAGKLVIELYANVVPKTAENFRALCTGEKGTSLKTGNRLHYKGLPFRFIDKELALGGDISNGECFGGESIYEGSFKDENYTITHHEAGLLSMGKSGPALNGSCFYILFVPQIEFNGIHVAFGKVVKGMEVLKKMREFGIREGETCGLVKIANCGEMSQDEKNQLYKDGNAKEVQTL